MNSLPEAVLQRWLTALAQFQPGLPQPVAIAMIQGAAKGPLGSALRQIEQSLLNLEQTALESLTGSEVRVMIAILQAMNIELAQLHAKLNGLWEYP